MKTYTIKSYLGETIADGISSSYCAKLDARVFSKHSLRGDYASVWEIVDNGNPPVCIGYADRGYWNSYQSDIRLAI